MVTRRLRRWACRVWLVSAGIAAGLGVPAAALADHETRATEIQENGIDPMMAALVVGAIVVTLVVFAAAILYWERQSEVREGVDGPERLG